MNAPFPASSTSPRRGTRRFRRVPTSRTAVPGPPRGIPGALPRVRDALRPRQVTLQRLHEAPPASPGARRRVPEPLHAFPRCPRGMSGCPPSSACDDSANYGLLLATELSSVRSCLHTIRSPDSSAAARCAWAAAGHHKAGHERRCVSRPSLSAPGGPAIPGDELW
jgi:hypothetical protein